MEFKFDIKTLLKPDEQGVVVLKGRNMIPIYDTEALNPDTTLKGQFYTLINRIGEASTKVNLEGPKFVKNCYFIQQTCCNKPPTLHVNE